MMNKEQQFEDRIFTETELEEVSRCYSDPDDKGKLYADGFLGKQYFIKLSENHRKKKKF